MIFILRGMMVALGFFGVLYCLLSVLTLCVWKGARLLGRKRPVRWARWLFAIRIFPLAGAAFCTLAFAIPAFLLLEPAAIDEDTRTVVFSVGALLLVAGGLLRVLTAQARAARLVAGLRERAFAPKPVTSSRMLPAQRDLPPLLLYGVSAPKLLVSDTAVAVLTADELRVAVRHELCHKRSRDNLKKLLLYGVPFPGMASLERAWLEMAEFAADEEAVSNPREALDLAAALIKLTKVLPVQRPPAFTTGLISLAGLAKLRVERLLHWQERSSRAVPGQRWGFLSLVLVTVSCAAYYGEALRFTHWITERFIH